MPFLHRKLMRSLRRHRDREDGSGTAMALLLLVACLALAAFAIDLQRVNSLDIQLQNVADNAAQAAIIARSTKTEAEAKAAAVNIARRNLSVAATGNVIATESVEFGTWNAVARTFTPVAGATDAVRVTLRRTAANGNPVRMLLLQIAGIDEMSLTRRAVMTGYDPDCLREGFVAQGMVDIQSNNTFRNAFCIHSNSVVKVSSNNSFELGVKVSMPDKTQVLMPNSGFDSSPGLEAALSSNRYDIRILGQIQTIINGLYAGSARFMPAYITNTTAVTLSPNDVRKGSFAVGRIYSITCTSNQKLTISDDQIVQKTVILTNCPITFASGAQIQDAVIATTNTDANSMSGPSRVVLGKDDDCAPGGGTQLLTLGGIGFSSGLEVYGAQLLAAKNISFSAMGTGVNGTAFVAGGTISGTSNMTMFGCYGSGMEQNFRMPFARLVM